MKFLASLLVLACMMAGTAAHARSAASATEEAKAASIVEATEAASTWLAYVDTKNYEESWNRTADIFKEAVTPEQWRAAVEPTREAVGPVVSRRLKSAQYFDSIPGAPEGEYVTVEFDTDFEKKPGSIERVTPKKAQDGTWKVSGYYLVK